MTKRTDLHIPLGTFIGAGPGHWDRTRLNYAGAECLLPLSITGLGLSAWQLMRLLGSDWPSTHLHQWREGRSSIGSLYLGRLCYLWYLKSKGFDICYLKRIDWVEGKAYWRKGRKGEEESKEAQEVPFPTIKDLKPKKVPIELQKRPSPSYRSVSIHRTPEEIEKKLKEKLGEVISDNTSITIPVIKDSIPLANPYQLHGQKHTHLPSTTVARSAIPSTRTLRAVSF